MCLQKGPFFAIFLNEGEISNWMKWLSLWFLAFYFCMTYISSCLNSISTAWKALMCAKCLFLDKRAVLYTIKYINKLFWFSWCNIISINFLWIVLYFFLIFDMISVMEFVKELLFIVYLSVLSFVHFWLESFSWKLKLNKDIDKKIEPLTFIFSNSFTSLILEKLNFLAERRGFFTFCLFFFSYIFLCLCSFHKGTV